MLAECVVREENGGKDNDDDEEYANEYAFINLLSEEGGAAIFVHESLPKPDDSSLHSELDPDCLPSQLPCAPSGSILPALISAAR
uniref:Uncharacterized protein n=1 Tax=Physcomitrium patens TaxID=3218 RepID=A0A2K1JQX0_PHYPA|nr:hypothetical protein PHYPA_016314 [Physcomitrium patens]